MHLEVGTSADQQQHHRHERVEVEKRRLYPPRTLPSGKNKSRSGPRNPSTSRAQTKPWWCYHGARLHEEKDADANAEAEKGGGREGGDRAPSGVEDAVAADQRKHGKEGGGERRFTDSFLLFIMCGVMLLLLFFT